MSLGEDVLWNLHRRGEFVRLLDEARTSRISVVRGTAAERLLVAHALASTGKVTEAEKLLQRLQPKELTGEDRPLSHIALGIVREQSADPEGAEKEYWRGAELARQSGGSIAGLWAELYRFRLLAERQPADVVAAMMPDLRRKVLRSGDRSVLAYLHMCIVVFEGQRGRLEEAQRHCGIVEAHLASVHNYSLHCAHQLNKGCIYFLDGNLVAAKEAFDEALRLVDRTEIGRAHV